MAPSGAMATPNINLASGSASDSGTIISGWTTKGGGTRASTSTWGLLLALNPIVEFFYELRWNYQRVKTKKLQSLQEFLHTPHESLQEAYAWMHRLIIVTQGVIEA